MKSIHSHRCGIVLMSVAQQHRIARIWRGYEPHWHDSQVGSSTPQNLMSVAGPDAICILAVAAAASSALMLAPPCADSLPEDTAFMRPAVTVDFSAWVADMVRR